MLGNENEKTKKLTVKQKKVYQGLTQHGPTGQTPHFLAIFLGYKESAYVSCQLKALLKKGLIVKIKGFTGKKTRYKVLQNKFIHKKIIQ